MYSIIKPTKLHNVIVLFVNILLVVSSHMILEDAPSRGSRPNSTVNDVMFSPTGTSKNAGLLTTERTYLSTSASKINNQYFNLFDLLANSIISIYPESDEIESTTLEFYDEGDEDEYATTNILNELSVAEDRLSNEQRRARGFTKENINKSTNNACNLIETDTSLSEDYSDCDNYKKTMEDKNSRYRNLKNEENNNGIKTKNTLNHKMVHHIPDIDYERLKQMRNYKRRILDNENMRNKYIHETMLRSSLIRPSTPYNSLVVPSATEAIPTLRAKRSLQLTKPSTAFRQLHKKVKRRSPRRNHAAFNKKRYSIRKNRNRQRNKKNNSIRRYSYH